MFWHDIPNNSMLENVEQLAHLSFTYKKGNKTDSMQPSVCKGPLVHIHFRSV